MNIKRKQVYNCCKYLHYLDIVDNNFTLENYRWLNTFKRNKVFALYPISNELSKNEKEMLQMVIEQIKINHAEEVKGYDEQIHKNAMKSLGELNYIFNLLGGNKYYNDLKGLM